MQRQQPARRQCFAIALGLSVGFTLGALMETSVAPLAVLSAAMAGICYRFTR